MRSPSVLIVEDNGVIAHDLKQSLILFGYAVSGIVSTGQEAIDHARASRPDVVLMDIGLPGRMDGVVAARYIQTHCKIPVIFLTAHADVGTLSRISLTRPAGFIVKPYHVRELQAKIEQALKSFKPSSG